MPLEVIRTCRNRYVASSWRIYTSRYYTDYLLGVQCVMRPRQGQKDPFFVD